MSLSFIFFQICSFERGKNEDITSMLKIAHKAFLFCPYHNPMLKTFMDPHFKCTVIPQTKKDSSIHVTISQSKSNDVLLNGGIGTKIFCQILDPEFFFWKLWSPWKSAKNNTMFVYCHIKEKQNQRTTMQTFNQI